MRIKTEQLQSVARTFKTEIEMIRDFASETDASLAATVLKPPANPFTTDEANELERVGTALSEAAARAKSKAPKKELIRIPVSDRVGQFIAGAMIPYKKRGFLSEMALSYLVSYLEAFFKEYLLCILIANPNLLRSGTTISTEEAISYSSMKALKTALAEKEVESLGYGSIDDVELYFQKRFNVALAKFPQWDKLREHVYRRNLIVHNQGKVNEIYKRKVGFAGSSKKLMTDMLYIEDAASRIIGFVDFVHMEMSRKFKLGGT